MDNKKCNGNNNRSPLIRFILKNFFGANITVTLVDGQTFTGEVVDGFDDVLALKSGGTIRFINGKFIVTFM